MALLLVALAGCQDWRDAVVPGQAIADPIQTPVEAAPTALEFDGVRATLTARAHYATKAWVVATDDGFDGPLGKVMPLDVALAWGPLGSPDILKTMRFHLKRRYVSVRWDGEMPLPHEAVMTHLSNHHLIPATPELHEYLRDVREGDLLELEGHLVDVDIANSRGIRTSMRRDDKGDGACEVLFVERAVITRR